MAAATRSPELRPSVAAVVDAIADVVEPLAGSRDLATTAASALLGSVLTTMASGQDHDADALRRRVTAGSHGIQYLDAEYLAEDLVENEPELFQRT
jgi:hypothetical protein